MKPDIDWQRRTSLSHIAEKRKELTASARPISDDYLAKVGADYVGAKKGQVLLWMRSA